jgi:hypothetical protein
LSTSDGSLLSDYFFRGPCAVFFRGEKEENSGLGDRYPVMMKDAVMGDNGEALNLFLWDEHSVKGVTKVNSISA